MLLFKRQAFVLLLVAVFATGLSLLPVSAQEEPYAPVIDPANFVAGVDHPYFPLVPGTTHIYEAQTEEGLERIEVSVLAETRVILGVICVVVHDTVWLDGVLIEDTFDWYAQDKDGNVWYMGEETREYEDGVVSSTAGAWEAGVDGAQPGIIMQADPQMGQTYRQEYYVGEAEDMAEVVGLDQSVTIGFGSFENVLVTREWTPLQPDVAENKSYAPGVGLILEEVVEGGSGRVELVAVLTPGEERDETGAEEEAEGAPGAMPVTLEEALQIASDALDGAAVQEAELEFEGGRWVYSVEGGATEISIDAILGEVIGSAGEDD